MSEDKSALTRPSTTKPSMQGDRPDIKNKPKGIARRFYKIVEVGQCGATGYEVLLDGRALKTPSKQRIKLSHRHIAQLIANEWAAQGENIIPVTMPVTRLVNVAIEITPQNRPELIKQARDYAKTDLLCYRSNDTRLFLEFQTQHWDPILQWGRTQGIDLKTTLGLDVIEQDPKALNVIADYAKGLDDLYLTLFLHLIITFGSSLLAMAVMQGHLHGKRGYYLSRLDEIWQIKYWGQVDDAKARSDAIEAEIIALCQILEQ